VMSKKSDQTTQSGAQLVVRALEAQGITHIFGVPGRLQRARRLSDSDRRMPLLESADLVITIGPCHVVSSLAAPWLQP
jgi:hypothetical protein